MSPDDPLIWLRAIHFTATATATGAALFLAVIADPVFRHAAGDAATAVAGLRARVVRIGWIGLLLCVASGAWWLIVVAARMSDHPAAEVATENAISAVVFQTQFGTASALRLACAVLLALLLVAIRSAHRQMFHSVAAVVLAGGLIGGLAWTGHAGAGWGATGSLHLAADVVHLIAAGAWVGGLLPLALLLAAARARPAVAALARCVTLRFSTLGLI